MQSKRNFLLGSLIFLLAFSVYLKALCPTVFVGDSGELITVSHVLGVAHPTGYPLTTLLMKAISFVPLDNVAARCNLTSSVFFALVNLEIYLLFISLGYRPFYILPGLILIIFIPVLGKEATVARVYGLNTFFILLLIRMTLNLRTNKLKKFF